MVVLPVLLRAACAGRKRVAEGPADGLLRAALLAGTVFLHDVVGALRIVLAGMKLRRFRSEQGAELLDLPQASLPDAETPAPARFLPTWDALLLVHARRTGILAEKHRKRIFHVRNPQSDRTFLVDGVVAGIWHHERGRIRLEPFRRLPREARVELREEAERLAAFHA